jgi:allantoin racemase
MKTIHLITPVITEGLRNIDEIAHLTRPDLRITQTILDRGPASIESEFDEALCVPDTIVKAIEAERAGADAIIIDCLGDPGLRPVREVVKIPVLGPAETSMHLAAMLGQRFSIVTVLDSIKPIARNLARIYGVYEKLASIRVVDIPVLEIHERLDEVQQRLAEAALLAVEHDDADVIILGCTGFLGCAAAIEEHLLAAGHDIPVIDPIPATTCIAEAVVKAGLRHSKRTYAMPRHKKIIGYDLPWEEKGN